MKTTELAASGTETMLLNLGPQHPSTHGVLRVWLELDGEVIVNADPDIGYLHRGIEKMCENRTYHQCLPLTDRLDYLAGSANNLGYVLAVEKLLGVEVPKRAQYIRVLMAEFTRIASHIFWLGTHGHDLGAMTPLFFAFREREDLMDLFEMVLGRKAVPLLFSHRRPGRRPARRVHGKSLGICQALPGKNQRLSQPVDQKSHLDSPDQRCGSHEQR